MVCAVFVKNSFNGGFIGHVNLKAPLRYAVTQKRDGRSFSSLSVIGLLGYLPDNIHETFLS